MESIRIQRTWRVFLMSACIGTADFVAIANKSDRPQIDIGFSPLFMVIQLSVAAKCPMDVTNLIFIPQPICQAKLTPFSET